MNRRQLLTSSAAAATLGGLTPSVSAIAGNKAKNLVMVFVSGGWDVTMSVAPQLDNPNVDGPRVDEDPNNPDDREYVLEYGQIRVAANDYKRPSTKPFFDAWSNRICVVNGVFTGAVGHETSTIRMLTGSASNTNPDLCAIIGHHHGQDLPLGYVTLAGPPFVGPYAASSGQVGFNSQLKLLFDQTSVYPTPIGTPYAYPLNAQTPQEQADVAAYIAGRADRWLAKRGTSTQLTDLEESVDRVARFKDSAGDLIKTLVLGRQPAFDTQANLAAELLSRGVCRSIMMDSKSAWDSHSNNAGQHENFQLLWDDLGTLMTELTNANLIDDTLVVVVSEMTRTPRLNANEGKDHWPHASVLMMGAGVKGNASVVGFDPYMESMKVDYDTGAATEAGVLLRHDGLAAGILEHLDIDPAEHFPESTPFRGFVA